MRNNSNLLLEKLIKRICILLCLLLAAGFSACSQSEAMPKQNEEYAAIFENDFLEKLEQFEPPNTSGGIAIAVPEGEELPARIPRNERPQLLYYVIDRTDANEFRYITTIGTIEITDDGFILNDIAFVKEGE